MAGFIAYYRVSTTQQGASGLGLDAQRAAVERHVHAAGGEIVATYTEIESGRKRQRPELVKALAHCKRSKAVLVIAKLDRLARNVAFVSALMEAGCEFIACDLPHASKLTLHILSAMAEHEADAISERTRNALAAYRARGGRLGSPENLTPDAQRKGAAANRRKATAADAKVLPILRALRSEGKGIKGIAAELNEAGYQTEGGHPWSPMRVKRALVRAGLYHDAEATI